MKIMICGNVFSDFLQLKKESGFVEADAILICGNVGIKKGTLFEQYWNGNIKIDIPIYCISGKYEDFEWIKTRQEDQNRYSNGHSDTLEHPEFTIFSYNYLSSIGQSFPEVWSFGGCSGTYSEKFYLADSAPMRHMTRKALFSVVPNLDIVLLHNVPGKLGTANELNFDDDLFKFIEEKQPRYIFVGGYDFNKETHFFRGRTTVVFLPVIDKGYAIVDTNKWDCYFNNKMK